MTAVENTANPRLNAPSRSEAVLVVDRTDITFHDLTRDSVMIQVKIRNEGEHRSSATSVRLESAPFGAFVPWRPLAILPVPALEPGESRELSVEAARPHPAPLGTFDRVPPTRVITAVKASSEEPTPQPGLGVAALLKIFRGRQSPARARESTVVRSPSLPADLWEWIGREQPHWAGNINVFVGNRAVERHFARALRIYAGRTNLAIFDVGGQSKSDAYAFQIAGLAPDWNAALYNMTDAKTILVGASDRPVQEQQWVEAAGMMLLVMAVRPPLVCEDGNLQVRVTQRSSQKSAVVEFNLDPTAQGAGCYVV